MDFRCGPEFLSADLYQFKDLFLKKLKQENKKDICYNDPQRCFGRLMRIQWSGILILKLLNWLVSILSLGKKCFIFLILHFIILEFGGYFDTMLKSS